MIIFFIGDDISSSTENDLVKEAIKFLKGVLNKMPNKQ